MAKVYVPEFWFSSATSKDKRMTVPVAVGPTEEEVRTKTEASKFNVPGVGLDYMFVHGSMQEVRR